MTKEQDTPLNDKADKLWSGRFQESTDHFVERFTASITFDQRLYQHDIDGSQAHARMLAKTGILSNQECEEIIQGLESIRAEIEAGQFE